MYNQYKPIVTGITATQDGLVVNIYPGAKDECGTEAGPYRMSINIKKDNNPTWETMVSLAMMSYSLQKPIRYYVEDCVTMNISQFYQGGIWKFTSVQTIQKQLFFFLTDQQENITEAQC